MGTHPPSGTPGTPSDKVAKVVKTVLSFTLFDNRIDTRGTPDEEPTPHGTQDSRPDRPEVDLPEKGGRGTYTLVAPVIFIKKVLFPR